MEAGQGPNWGCSAKEKKSSFMYVSDKYVHTSITAYEFITTKKPIIIIIIIIMALQPFVGPWPIFQLLDPWRGDQPVARPLPKHRTTQTQTKRTQNRHQYFGRDSNP
jgi:hypothetical protein